MIIPIIVNHTILACEFPLYRNTLSIYIENVFIILSKSDFNLRRYAKSVLSVYKTGNTQDASRYIVYFSNIQ